MEAGLRRSWAVTTFNRHGAGADDRVERLSGDRLHVRDLALFNGREWDVVVDTWAGAPRAARDSATALADRAGRYVYVSSCSVYAPPPLVGGDESVATVEGSPDAQAGEYASLKRGSEMAIEAAFGGRALMARAGLILGPHEDAGRLPWWLLRMDRGGEVLAPGPADLALQYVDARDLARWILDAATSDVSGVCNVASRSGHATMGALLDACRDVTGGTSSLTWVDPGYIERARIEPWSQLPIWLPPNHEFRGMHAANVERAHAAGLRCRPVEETVKDTWDWVVSIDKDPPLRPDLDPPGLDAAIESAALAAWHAARRTS